MNLRKAHALLLATLLPIVLAGCKSTSYYDRSTIANSGGSGEVDVSKMGGGIDVDNAPHG